MWGKGRSAALVALLLAAACPMPEKPPPAQTVSGVYHARLPAPGASARVVTLWVQPGGVAALETVDVGKGRLPVEQGSWTVAGDELTVRLDGQAAPLVFAIQGEQLVARQWDRTAYGASGLTLTRRAAYNPERSNPFETKRPDDTP